MDVSHRDLEQVVVQHYQVGPFAGLDGSRLLHCCQMSELQTTQPLCIAASLFGGPSLQLIIQSSSVNLHLAASLFEYLFHSSVFLSFVRS